METIQLAVWVNAPAERCYRLATSMEFHSSQIGSPFAAKAGGLQPGDKLPWPDKWMGMRLDYTTRVEVLRPFAYYREVLESGAFRRLEHDHHFTTVDDGTRVRDELLFEARAPLTGPLLRRYLHSQLKMRSLMLKQAAECGAWRNYLEPVSGGSDSNSNSNDAPSVSRNDRSGTSAA